MRNLYVYASMVDKYKRVNPAKISNFLFVADVSRAAAAAAAAIHNHIAISRVNIARVFCCCFLDVLTIVWSIVEYVRLCLCGIDICIVFVIYTMSRHTRYHCEI